MGTAIRRPSEAHWDHLNLRYENRGIPEIFTGILTEKRKQQCPVKEKRGEQSQQATEKRRQDVAELSVSIIFSLSAAIFCFCGNIGSGTGPHLGTFNLATACVVRKRRGIPYKKRPQIEEQDVYQDSWSVKAAGKRGTGKCYADINGQ